MSQSTDAILFYGVCFDEEGSNHDDERENLWPDGSARDNSDWEEVFAARAGGVKAPDVEYGPDTKSLYSEFWDKKRQYVKENATCDIATHCSGACPMPYVALNGTRTTASRGCPERISTEPFERIGTDMDDDKVREFCRIMGIEIGERRIGWWLVSDWC